MSQECCINYFTPNFILQNPSKFYHMTKFNTHYTIIIIIIIFTNSLSNKKIWVAIVVNFKMLLAILEEQFMPMVS